MASHPVAGYRRSRMRPLAGAVAGLLLACAPLGGQERHPIVQTDHPGRWTPLTVYLGGGRQIGPTAAESRAMKANLDSLISVVRRSPALADPRGFETIGSETVQQDDPPLVSSGWQPVRGMVHFIPLLWWRLCDSCVLQRSGEGVGTTIAVNDLRLLMGGVPTGGCGGPVVFPRPRQVALIGGYPLYNNGALLIAARDVPVFVPVTRDDWIDAQINAGKNAQGCLRPDERQRARWESIRGTASPAERAMEAWERPAGREGPPGPFQWLLGQPGARGSRPYVRFNPALFDSTIARTAIQTMTLTVGFRSRDPRPLPRGTPRPLPCSAPISRSADLEIDGLAIHEGIMCGLDWPALRALLR
jgi:hypothetical protein